ncbi:MAG: alpha/beta fold hydrolase [Nitriliruptor sp.]|nr:MAG: alpha/beta fold hydrolase [Nitriliruptor sp.]
MMGEMPATVELAADVTGAGPVLVLLHGITEDARSWEPLVGPLATDHTVLTVDLRGHGRSPEADTYDPVSMAADVHAVLVREGLDDDPPLVVGHSMGGLVAVAYGAMFPTRGGHHEAGHPSRVLPGGRQVLVRQHLRDPRHRRLDERRPVQPVPPVRHREAEAGGRRWSCRPVQAPAGEG